MTEIFIGSTVHTTSGRQLGTITDVFPRPGDNETEWVTVRSSGLLAREHFVPVAAITRSGGGVLLVSDVDADLIKHTRVPRDRVGPDDDESRELYRHYGIHRHPSQYRGFHIDDESPNTTSS